MRFKLKSKAFHGCLASAIRAIDSRTPLLVLNNFFIRLTGSSLCVTAGNSEVRLSFNIPVDESDGDCSFLADARRLTEIFKTAPDCEAELTYDAAKSLLSVNCATARYKLPTISADEYPVTDGTSNEALSFCVTVPQIAQGLALTSFAVGTDALRPAMMGVHFDVKADSLTLVASDTRVLARCRMANVAPGVECAFTLPTRAVDIIQRVLPASKSEDTTIRISVDRNLITLQTDSMRFQTQYYKAQYPDYNRVIPTTATSTITAPRRSLIDAISRVGLVGASNNLLTLDINTESIAIESMDTATQCSASDAVTCVGEGAPVRIGFSADNLKRLLDAMPGNDLNMGFTDSTRPGVFKPVAPDIDVVAICMPMSIME